MLWCHLGIVGQRTESVVRAAGDCGLELQGQGLHGIPHPCTQALVPPVSAAPGQRGQLCGERAAGGDGRGRHPLLLRPGKPTERNCRRECPADPHLQPRPALPSGPAFPLPTLITSPLLPQVRGSIPVLWSQTPNLTYKIPIRIAAPGKADSPFAGHVRNLVENYKVRCWEGPWLRWAALGCAGLR